MCNFLSVLILKNGDVLQHPMLDSHSDLVTYFKLPDTSEYVSYFAKAELTPVDWADASTWKWVIDEPTRPGWLDDVGSSAVATSRAMAQRMVIRAVEHALSVEWCWLVMSGSYCFGYGCYAETHKTERISPCGLEKHG